MSIEYLNRLKALEAENIALKERLSTLEAHTFGVEADEDLNDIEVPSLKRKPGRPRKEAVQA